MCINGGKVPYGVEDKSFDLSGFQYHQLSKLKDSKFYNNSILMKKTIVASADTE